MTAPLTFRGFLQLQSDRTDVVGDLARAHRSCSFTSYQAFTRHLLRDHDDIPDAEFAACRSVHKAWRSYARRRGVPA